MSIQDGTNVLLAVGNGDDPEIFMNVGGMRITSLALANRVMDATDRESGAWRDVVSTAGPRSVRISGQGFFSDSASEELVRGNAFSAACTHYRITFPNSDTLTGAFLISAYAREGEIGQEERFMLALESSGAVTFVAG